MIKDFVIPLDKDELLVNKPGQYFVQNVYSLRLLPQVLDDARNAFQTNGVNFILEHFDVFFSVLVHGKKIELSITLRAFTRLQKVMETFVSDMENMSELGNELEEEEKFRLVNICKMLAYLFTSFILYIDQEIAKDVPDQYTGKRKKPPKSDTEEEWDYLKEKSLEYIYRLLQSPLQKLWQPTIVEDSFVTMFTKVCYKLLEQCTQASQKSIRQTIFEILGTSVKKYNHGISCVVRIIQLVQVHDILPAYIATGVVHMIQNCGCTGLIKEIMKEIDQRELSETESRNLSTFLETIAGANPNLIIPYLDDIMDGLSSEHYTMRNCTICIIREIVQKALTGDDLTQEQKVQRDDCLNNLEEHILDVNAFVRSKVLQVWQHLCCEGAIPVSRQGRLLAHTVLRLEDKSAVVRKYALQLIRALLQGNPFAAKLNKVEISKSLEKEEINLRKLQTQHVSKSTRGDSERLELWNASLPEIRNALKKIIQNEQENNNKENDENENEENEENIDPDAMFEHVRQLMLNGKVLLAVKSLWKTCVKLKQCPDMENFTPEAKEEFLFLLLMKTFMESENLSTTKEKSEEEKDKQEITTKKKIVNYLKDSLKFATELEASIPMVEKLLFSSTAGDAVEACTLLGVAYEFGVTGAADSIREALLQVFHRDQSVRNNIAMVYKGLYLDKDEGQKSERQKALACVKALIELVKKLEPGQSKALTKLILMWYENDDINSEVVQILWEIFSMKSPDTDPLDSRAALMLITMIAQAQDSIITGNFDVLIKVGLGPRAKTDLLLARDTCRAFCAIKHKSDDIQKTPLRHPNDHEMFKEILTLLIENFTNTKEDGYISFATDAINAVYHLANQPDRLMKQYLFDICNRGKFTSNDDSEKTVPLFLLSKLLYVISHIAIQQMVHLDTSIYKELKRRDMIRSEKKNKNKKTDTRKSMSTTPSSARQMIRSKETSIIEDNGEEAVEGAAEDADAEFIDDILENHIVTGEGLLAQFVPLVVEVCQHSNKYNAEDVQAAGTLALGKMMTVSSVLCEEYLQLLITILERSPHSKIRITVLIAIRDLTSRFPNLIEPWMKHVYGRLRDTDTSVRRTCVRILANLIIREMVRVRGQISELALCIIDKDQEIQQDTREFFRMLSQKGNALYNVVPDILSRLTDLDLDISEPNFQEIVKHILSLLSKETQIDAIISKICSRFKLATSERQWRDFAYCLSLLQFSPKSVRCFIESLPQLKEKLTDAQVLKSIQSVVDQTKKKPNTKIVCIELEEKLEHILKGSTDEPNECGDKEIMPPPPVPKSRRRTRRPRQRSSSDEEDDVEDNDVEQTPTRKPKGLRRSRVRKSSSSSDSDSEVPTKNSRKEVSTPASSAKKSRKERINASIATPSASLTKRNRHNTPRNRKN